MNNTLIRDLLSQPANAQVSFPCWIAKRRKSKHIIFLDVQDSSGTIQLVVEQAKVGDDLFDLAKSTPLESALNVKGTLVSHQNKDREVSVRSFEVVSTATHQLSPTPRSDIDIFDPSLQDHLLSNRHLYLRNPKYRAIMKIRDIVMHAVRCWFNENGFTSIDAPILTPLALYEDASAMSIDVRTEKVFLTQCVGYYLEAACQSFDRVYNMGPSFRGEESRSKRHLMEYWHIKAELNHGNLEDMIRMVEELISFITNTCWKQGEQAIKDLGTDLCLDGLQTPFARISYDDAIKQLQESGLDIEWGEGLSTREEEILSTQFDGPFWITGVPRVVEPFPYVIDPEDPRITKVADLIASNGYGELLGTAEKIYDPDMLRERMAEKGKLDDPRYDWVREVHDAGCFPHIAFGMGVERMVRWLLNVPHVRDAIAFPRTYRRRVHP